jgi:ribosome-binding protein aMBF1 (putative translation factor)
VTASQKHRIAEQIRAAIERSDLSRYEIAKRSGVDQAILSRFVAGNAGLNLDSIEKLAPVLGIRVVTTAGKKRGA